MWASLGRALVASRARRLKIEAIRRVRTAGRGSDLNTGFYRRVPRPGAGCGAFLLFRLCWKALLSHRMSVCGCVRVGEGEGDESSLRRKTWKHG